MYKKYNKRRRNYRFI